MASESGRSPLFDKYGSRLTKAAATYQHEEAKSAGYSEIPAGINGGIAQVKKCYFDTYKTGDNKGEFFFYAAAVVISPTFFAGEQVAGKMTVLPIEPVCDTPNRSRKTLEDHVRWIQNEMKKMGCPAQLLSAENLELGAEWIRKRKPHIKFRTWKGEKPTSGPYKDREPQIRHDWLGSVVLQESPETLAARAVTESTGSQGNGNDVEVDVDVVDNEPDNGNQSYSDAPTAPVNRVSRTTSDRDVTNTDADGAESESSAAGIGELDNATIKDLVARANADDLDATRILERMAEDVGVSRREVELADNWDEVYKLIQNTNAHRKAVTSSASKEGHSTGEHLEEVYTEKDEEGGVKAGSIYLLRLADPQTGKPGKPSKVEVLSVDEQASTVDVKVLGTHKKIPNVAWKHLMPLE